jgi:hypothetical protein
MPPKRKSNKDDSDAEVDLKNINFDSDNEEVIYITKLAILN